MTEYGKALRAKQTPIPGLLLWELSVYGDNRGWLKENWQRENMIAAGLPDFGPVQNNISFNDAAGTTRGIHAEPWDKFISVATGRIFGAWVDLRAGPTFGTAFTTELDPSRAVFVPRGVGNSFQTLEPDTAYVYLVNDYYSPDSAYAALNLGDETAAIDWPIPVERAELSVKDRSQPRLADVTPVAPRKTLVLGATGQLGRALRESYGGAPQVEFAAVDAAESPDGRAAAWATDVTVVAALAPVAAAHGITLVHVSSDYVFDGTAAQPYREDDPVAPLGVYGQTKAAGDQIVATVPKHYIVRTSWVIGEGRVRAHHALSGHRRHRPRGRRRSARAPDVHLGTRPSDRHLVDTPAPYGTYNVTGSGSVTTWADIARRAFTFAGHDPNRVTGVSTDEYFAAKDGPVAPRPAASGIRRCSPCQPLSVHLLHVGRRPIGSEPGGTDRRADRSTTPPNPAAVRNPGAGASPPAAPSLSVRTTPGAGPPAGPGWPSFQPTHSPRQPPSRSPVVLAAISVPRVGGEAVPTLPSPVRPMPSAMPPFMLTCLARITLANGIQPRMPGSTRTETNCSSCSLTWSPQLIGTRSRTTSGRGSTSWRSSSGHPT